MSAAEAYFRQCQKQLASGDFWLALYWRFNLRRVDVCYSHDEAVHTLRRASVKDPVGTPIGILLPDGRFEPDDSSEPLDLAAWQRTIDNQVEIERNWRNSYP